MWTRIVGNLENREDRYPNFKEFCSFIKHESDIMVLPITQAISTQAHVLELERGDGISQTGRALFLHSSAQLIFWHLQKIFKRNLTSHLWRKSNRFVTHNDH